MPPYILFFLSIYWLHPNTKKLVPEPSADSSPKAAIQGIRAIVGSGKTAWALLSVFATAFFCGPLITFSPVIVKNILHADVGQFGGALTAFGVGGMLGPLLILALRRRDPMKLSLTAALFYGLLILAVSRVGHLWQLAALLVGSGFLLTVSNTSANTFLELHANNRIRGQTASLYVLAMRDAGHPRCMSWGNLATGAAISLSDIRLVFVINGLLAVAVQALVLRRMFPGQRQTELRPA